MVWVDGCWDGVVGSWNLRGGWGGVVYYGEGKKGWGKCIMGGCELGGMMRVDGCEGLMGR